MEFQLISAYKKLSVHSPMLLEVPIKSLNLFGKGFEIQYVNTLK